MSAPAGTIPPEVAKRMHAATWLKYDKEGKEAKLTTTDTHNDTILAPPELIPVADLKAPGAGAAVEAAITGTRDLYIGYVSTRVAMPVAYVENAAGTRMHLSGYYCKAAYGAMLPVPEPKENTRPGTMIPGIEVPLIPPVIWDAWHPASPAEKTAAKAAAMVAKAAAAAAKVAAAKAAKPAVKKPRVESAAAAAAAPLEAPRAEPGRGGAQPVGGATGRAKGQPAALPAGWAPPLPAALPGGQGDAMDEDEPSSDDAAVGDDDEELDSYSRVHGEAQRAERPSTPVPSGARRSAATTPERRRPAVPRASGDDSDLDGDGDDDDDGDDAIPPMIGASNLERAAPADYCATGPLSISGAAAGGSLPSAAGGVAALAAARAAAAVIPSPRAPPKAAPVVAPVAPVAPVASTAAKTTRGKRKTPEPKTAAKAAAQPVVAQPPAAQPPAIQPPVIQPSVAAVGCSSEPQNVTAVHEAHFPEWLAHAALRASIKCDSDMEKRIADMGRLLDTTRSDDGGATLRRIGPDGVALLIAAHRRYVPPAIMPFGL